MRSVFLLFSLAAAAPLSAQVGLAFRSGHSVHLGHAEAAGLIDSPSLRPGGTADHALEIALDRNGWRLAAIRQWSGGDLVMRGEESGVISPDAVKSTGHMVTAGRRIGGAGPAALHGFVGAVRRQWSFPVLAGGTTSGWGALLGVEMEWAAFRGIALTFRYEIERGGSFVGEEDLPEGYRLRAGHRAGFSAGLRWRAGDRR